MCVLSYNGLFVCYYITWFIFVAKGLYRLDDLMTGKANSVRLAVWLNKGMRTIVHSVGYSAAVYACRLQCCSSDAPKFKLRCTRVAREAVWEVNRKLLCHKTSDKSALGRQRGQAERAGREGKHVG